MAWNVGFGVFFIDVEFSSGVWVGLASARYRTPGRGKGGAREERADERLKRCGRVRERRWWVEECERRLEWVFGFVSMLVQIRWWRWC